MSLFQHILHVFMFLMGIAVSASAAAAYLIGIIWLFVLGTLWSIPLGIVLGILTLSLVGGFLNYQEEQEAIHVRKSSEERLHRKGESE